MYNFSLETLLHFAKIRQLRGMFRSAAFYGFGDLYDPCVVMITVQSGVMSSCTIYDHHAQIIEMNQNVMNVLQRTIVEWVFENTAPEPIYRQAPSFNPASFPPLPYAGQSVPNPGLQTGDIAQQRTLPSNGRRDPQQQWMPPSNGMRNPQHADAFPVNPPSYEPTNKNPSKPFTAAPEPHYPVPPYNSGSTLDRFSNFIPLRLKTVSRSEVLQWKGNVKSIYMRTNGINTIAQIAAMLSLSISEVLQILIQLEQDGLISLGR